jgi:hypothetical protein
MGGGDAVLTFVSSDGEAGLTSVPPRERRTTAEEGTLFFTFVSSNSEQS